VTSDAFKADELGTKYSVDAVFSYDQFGEALVSGRFDAIYLATPNWRHAEFIVPALKAGIHVFTEKPLEVSTAKYREILGRRGWIFSQTHGCLSASLRAHNPQYDRTDSLWNAG